MRVASIRPRSSRKMLDTPPLNTAAKPTFEPPPGWDAPWGSGELNTSATTVTAAIAPDSTGPRNSACRRDCTSGE